MTTTTDFNGRFGTAPNTTAPNATSDNSQRRDQDGFEPAQFWLNVGYLDTIDIDEGTETRFVSRTKGIGLDEWEDITASTSNELCRIIQEARDELLSQVMDAARSLDPGDARIIGYADGLRGPRSLQVLLSRVEAEPPAIEAAVKAGASSFSGKLSLVG